MIEISPFTLHQYPGLYRALGWQPLPAAPAAPTCYHCRDKGTVAVRLSGGRLDTMPCQYCAAGERWAYRRYCCDRVTLRLPVWGFARWLANELKSQRRWQEHVMGTMWNDYAAARYDQQTAQAL